MITGSKGGTMKNAIMIGVSILFVMSLFMGYAPPPVEAKTRFITIGTGGKTGLYYLTGGAVARLVNKKVRKYNLRATAESTGGSVYNVDAIIADKLEFGIVQSDRQYQAWKGINTWANKGPQKGLRSICSFHPETVILVAGEDAGIKTLEDIRGKVVNIGNPGSGQRGNANDILKSCGLDKKMDLMVKQFEADEQAKALQNYRIDAFFYTVGHPNASIREATNTKRKVRFVPLEGPCIDSLVAKCQFYTNASIPIKFYPLVKNKETVNTIAVKATFCTNARVPKKIVYAVTKEIFANVKSLKRIHPAFAGLTHKSMLKALSAPIHPGAMQYYKEVGLR